MLAERSPGQAAFVGWSGVIKFEMRDCACERWTCFKFGGFRPINRIGAKKVAALQKNQQSSKGMAKRLGRHYSDPF